MVGINETRSLDTIYEKYRENNIIYKLLISKISNIKKRFNKFFVNNNEKMKIQKMPSITIKGHPSLIVYQDRDDSISDAFNRSVSVPIDGRVLFWSKVVDACLVQQLYHLCILRSCHNAGWWRVCGQL